MQDLLERYYSESSKPEPKQLDHSLVDRVIANRETWNPCDFGMNARCWFFYACKPVHDWWEMSQAPRAYDFCLYNEIFRSALGKKSDCPFAGSLRTAYNDVPKHPDLFKFVHDVCIDKLLQESSAMTDNSSLLDLQYYSANLQFYIEFAGVHRIGEFHNSIDKLKRVTNKVVKQEIGNAYCIYHELKSLATVVSSMPRELPWGDSEDTNVIARYGDRSGEPIFFKFHKIEYGYAEHHEKIFLAMLLDTDNSTHGKQRVWTVSYDRNTRKVNVHVRGEIVKRFAPDSVVQLGLDLYMKRDGFGYQWMSTDTHRCETAIRDIALDGLRILERSKQWSDFIDEIAAATTTTQ